jgi:gluconate 2-dehydrogenase gamma chain
MITRRQLLASASAFLLLSTGNGFARVIQGNGLPWAPNTAHPPVPVRPGRWKFFTADEASLVEALVDRLIPPDNLGAGGKDAGCAAFIDRQLTGPYGSAEDSYMRPPFMPGVPGQGYQGPDAPATRYRTSLKIFADQVRASAGGKRFEDHTADEKDKILGDLEKGKIDITDKGFFALLLKNTMEGFFADPIYGGNRDMAGWKLIGFPGARYDYRDWIDKHNQKYPLPPVSIMGRTAWNLE